MNFKSVWLIVLTMLMGSASAANINFNGGSVGSCTLSGSTYNCSSSFAPGSDDILAIASGYTVVLSNAFTPGWSQGLSMSGSAALQSSGGIDLTGSNNINVSGGTLTAGGNFRLGSNAQTITANVVAASITTGGSSATINGNVSVTGNADLGSHTTISGTVKVGTISTNSDVSMGTLSATGSISLGSKTSITGAVSGASINTNSQVTMGSLSVTGTADLGSQTTVNGALSANVVTTNSNVTLKGDVTAASSFTLGSGSDLTGNVTAPTVTLNPSNVTVKGNIAASGSLDIGSGNTVTGKVTGGSLLMRPANATINGSVTMTGDVDMGSHSNINGDLVARDVVTRSAFANINGNAAVNSIYIDWNDAVNGVITCTGAGAVDCSCVTKADPNYKPVCGAAPPGAPHHFQIAHSGSALTCQPQTVTVTACANLNCTAPHYTSNVDVTLQPGGQTFTVSGGVNPAATVQSKKEGTYTLSATASGVSNDTTCINSGSGKACDMEFKGTGLLVSVPNHISMRDGVLVTIQALTSAPGQPSCVPLVAGKTVDVDVTCSYKNPASGSKNVVIGDKSALCGPNAFGPATAMPFTFGIDGKATATLQYSDVGRVSLNAAYTTPGLSASGDGDFIAAPARIQVTATNAGGQSYGPATLNDMPGTVFAKASENFTLTATAVNDKNVATPNFGKESTASKVRFTPTVNKSDDKPVAAPVPNGTGNAGGLSYVFPKPYSGGSASANANFDNVGYLKISAALDDGVTNANAYYLGDPLSFQPSGTQYVARFVPDHFDTELMADIDLKDVRPTTHMDCAKAKVNPCGPGSTRFINSGQSFFLKVTAYNGASPPAVASNYAGALAKVIDLKAMTANGGDDPAKIAAGKIEWSSDDAAARYTFGAGIGVLPTAAGSNLPKFTSNSSYPTTDVLPSTIYLRATDADGVTSKRSTSVEAPLTVVGGRLLVANAYGSPTAPLPVGVTAQFYTSQGYIYNQQLDATSTDAVSDRKTFSNCQRGLAVPSCPGSLAVTNPGTKLTLTNGIGKFSIAAPKPTVIGIGRVDIQLNQGTTQLFPYLPSSTGTETFGLYPSGPVIYTREIY
jgi:MSHA biogenesis protein MshQ